MKETTRFELENRFGGQAAPTPWKIHLHNQRRPQDCATDAFLNSRSLQEPIRWAAIVWQVGAMVAGLGILSLAAWLCGVGR